VMNDDMCFHVLTIISILQVGIMAFDN
jgi:hypothetical protein